MSSTPAGAATTNRWVECSLGHHHWGSAGAAGLLVRSSDGRVLMQHRAPWVDHGDTWGIPSGALHEGETPVCGALREATEEFGTDLAGRVSVQGVVEDDHGGWVFHTVIATMNPDALGDALPGEASGTQPGGVDAVELGRWGHRWVPITAVLVAAGVATARTGDPGDPGSPGNPGNPGGAGAPPTSAVEPWVDSLVLHPGFAAALRSGLLTPHL